MMRTIRKRLAFARLTTLHRRSLRAILKWQDREVSRIAAYAYQNVPMWREIFSRSGLDEKAIQGVSDLEKIPLTNKDTYRSRMLEEYVDASRPFTPISSLTSGTTGQPFESYLADLYGSNTFLDFALYRFMLWEGKSLGEIARTKIARIKKSVYATPYRLGLDYAEFRKDPKKIFLQLAAFQPEALSSIVTVLYEIARMIESDKTLPRLSPRYIVSSGELISPSLRAYMNKQFGVEMYDRYGMGEMANRAHECRMHDGLHINSESTVVEITDASGNPVPHGECGKVVLTDLINYTMPFIRYDIGDMGKISYEPCPCGLYSPRLWIIGKNVGFLMDGARLTTKQDFRFLTSLPHGVMQFQFVKRSEYEVLLRIVPGIAWDNSMYQQIEQSVQEFLGWSITLRVEIVSSISKGPSGKSEVVIDESISINR